MKKQKENADKTVFSALENMSQDSSFLSANKDTLMTMGSGDALSSAANTGSDSESMDWDDVHIGPQKETQQPTGVELTLESTPQAIMPKKTGASKKQKQLRFHTHCMHVQYLLFHGAVRNMWCNQKSVQEIVYEHLPKNLRTVVKKRGKKDSKDTEETLRLIRSLIELIQDKFVVSAPGLRKNGYRPISSQLPDDGEVVDLEKFKDTAKTLSGSRDMGAQMFVALCRAAGLDARLVFSLQPLGFRFNKGEESLLPKQPEKQYQTDTSDSEYEHHRAKRRKKATKENENSDGEGGFLRTKEKKKYDTDLLQPVFWTEIWQEEESKWVAVDAMIHKTVLSIDEEMKTLEPRPSDKVVMAYVVAYESDCTARDVTVRYVKKWPGRTGSFRVLPYGTADDWIDWWADVIRPYERRYPYLRDLRERAALAPVEEAPSKDLPTTLSGFKASDYFVLPRHLLREETIRPDAKPVSGFLIGKGSKGGEEDVYRRQDIEVGKTIIVWKKEGRQVKEGQQPIKRVKARMMTINRKREHEVGGSNEPVMDLLFSRRQTELFIPPPIVDGKIPRGPYGNIDIFTKSMIPAGATHIPERGTVKVCKKLGVDYAEAVTGFEFSKKRAFPIVEGVVVASEHAEEVEKVFREDKTEQARKEREKKRQAAEKERVKLARHAQIKERIAREYGTNLDTEEVDHLIQQREAVDDQKVSKRRKRQAGGKQEAHEDEQEDEVNEAALEGGFMRDNSASEREGFMRDGETSEYEGGFVKEDASEDEARSVTHEDRSAADRTETQRTGPPKGEAPKSNRRRQRPTVEEEEEEEGGFLRDEPKQSGTKADPEETILDDESEESVPRPKRNAVTQRARGKAPKSKQRRHRPTVEVDEVEEEEGGFVRGEPKQSGKKVDAEETGLDDDSDKGAPRPTRKSRQRSPLPERVNGQKRTRASNGRQRYVEELTSSDGA